MKLLVDMNLAPAWCERLAERGFEAVHRISVGAATASDAEIMSYARASDMVVLTADLDFSAILAATGADAPSVVQVRASDVMALRVFDAVGDVLGRFDEALRAGAIVSIDDAQARVRVLPLR